MRVSFILAAVLAALSLGAQAQTADTAVVSNSSTSAIGGTASIGPGVTGGVTLAGATSTNTSTAAASQTSPLGADTANTSASSVGGDSTVSASLGLAASSSVATQDGTALAAAQSNPGFGDQATSVSGATVQSGSTSNTAFAGFSFHTNTVGAATDGSATAQQGNTTATTNTLAGSTSFGVNLGLAAGFGGAAFNAGSIAQGIAP